MGKIALCSPRGKFVDYSKYEATKPKLLKDVNHVADEVDNGPKNGVTLIKEKARRHSELAQNGLLLPTICGSDYSSKVVKPLHLKGHVKYLKSLDMVLFVCSPM